MNLTIQGPILVPEVQSVNVWEEFLAGLWFFNWFGATFSMFMFIIIDWIQFLSSSKNVYGTINLRLNAKHIFHNA